MLGFLVQSLTILPGTHCRITSETGQVSLAKPLSPCFDLAFVVNKHPINIGFSPEELERLKSIASQFDEAIGDAIDPNGNQAGIGGLKKKSTTVK